MSEVEILQLKEQLGRAQCLIGEKMMEIERLQNEFKKLDEYSDVILETQKGKSKKWIEDLENKIKELQKEIVILEEVWGDGQATSKSTVPEVIIETFKPIPTARKRNTIHFETAALFEDNSDHKTIQNSRKFLNSCTDLRISFIESLLMSGPEKKTEIPNLQIPENEYLQQKEPETVDIGRYIEKEKVTNEKMEKVLEELETAKKELEMVKKELEKSEGVITALSEEKSYLLAEKMSVEFLLEAADENKSRKISELQEEITKLTEEKKVAVEKLEKITRYSSERQNQIDQLNVETENLKETFQELQEENEQLQLLNHFQISRLEHTEQSVKILEAQVTGKMEEIIKLKQYIVDLEQNLEDSRMELQNEIEEKTAVKSLFEAVKNRNSKLQVDLTVTKNELHKSETASLEKNEKENKELEKVVKELADCTVAISREKIFAFRVKSESELLLKEEKRKAEELEQKLQKAVGEKSTLEQELERQRIKIEQLESNIHNDNERLITELKDENDHLKIMAEIYLIDFEDERKDREILAGKLEALKIQLNELQKKVDPQIVPETVQNFGRIGRIIEEMNLH